MVDTLNSGRARDATLATCARNIWLLTAMFNIINLMYMDLKLLWLIYLLDGIIQLGISEKVYKFIPQPIWVNSQLDLTLLNYSI